MIESHDRNQMALEWAKAASQQMNRWVQTAVGGFKLVAPLPVTSHRPVMSFSAGILAMGAANLALAPGVRAAAPEHIVDEAPVSALVKDEPAPMEEAYPEEVRLPTAFPRLRKRLEKAE